MVAWSLLSASVLWGLALSTKVLGPKPRPNWMLDVHRFLGGLAVTFTAIHVAGLVMDTYVHFGPTEVLVPFTGTYRPAAVAWGIIGLYLLAAVELTSLLRKRLPRRLWRLAHLLSFPVFALSTIHGVFSGTDAGTGSPLFVAMVAVGVAVLSLTVARVDAARQKARRGRGQGLPVKGGRHAPGPRFPASPPPSPPFVAPLAFPHPPQQEYPDVHAGPFVVDSPGPTHSAVGSARRAGTR